MKKIGKIVLGILIGVILVVDIFLTAYLLSYNKFNVAELGNKSWLIMKNDFEDYVKGDLVIVKKDKKEDIKAGDYVFFYNTANEKKLISYGKVEKVTINSKKDASYSMDNNYILSYDYLIGTKKNAKKYAQLGAIIGVLSSRWIFLAVIIIPLLLLFLSQLYLLIMELKKAK